MRRKQASHRISVNLPKVMWEHYYCQSEVSGVSISRLIYLRLRSRKPIVLIPQRVQDDIRQFLLLLKDIEKQRTVSNEALDILRQYSQIFTSLVEQSDKESYRKELI